MKYFLPSLSDFSRLMKVLCQLQAKVCSQSSAWLTSMSNLPKKQVVMLADRP